MYRWFRQWISTRGILAIAIGAMFLVVLIQPERFFAEPMPALVSSLSLVVGLAMILAGLVLLRFKWRRARLVAADRPVQTMATLHKEEESDSTSCWAYLGLGGETWRIGFDQTAGRYEGPFGVEVPVDAWLDSKTREPVAIAVNGAQLNTLYKAYRV
jgi:hypothetical protein